MTHLTRRLPLTTATAALLAGVTLSLTTPLKAQDEHGRSAGSHVHGAAELNAALDGKDLMIELRSALWNVLGFEREARSAEEKQAVEGAMAVLADGLSLFGLPEAAGCTQHEKDIDLGAAKGDEDHDHEKDHGHDDHDHDDHDHDKHDHDEHKHSEHDHEDHKDGEDDHAGHDHDDSKDLVASYSFTCARPQALNQFSVTLFERFERLEEVKASFLSAKVQAAATLNPDSPVFSLR